MYAEDLQVPAARITLAFDAALYPAEVLERAAYRFTDSLALELLADNGQWLCSLCFDAGIGQVQAEALTQTFRKEVLDQKLRASIRAQTEATRTLILARAFSRTGLSPEN